MGLSWIMGFENELNPIAWGHFNSRRVYSSENEPGRWSSFASRVESTAYCELLLVNLHTLSLSLSSFFSHRAVSKHGGSFYNRIYRRTGGTTKRTWGVKRTRRDIVRLEIRIASKLRSRMDSSDGRWWSLWIEIESGWIKPAYAKGIRYSMWAYLTWSVFNISIFIISMYLTWKWWRY